MNLMRDWEIVNDAIEHRKLHRFIWIIYRLMFY